MDHGRLAELQVVLEGISLPASRDELIAYASREDAAAAGALDALPDGDYDRIDEVAEALLRTQPATRADQGPPAPESGLPPGGDDYLNPRPEPGHVRPSIPPGNPPQDAIEKASRTQKRQQAIQEQGP